MYDQRRSDAGATASAIQAEIAREKQTEGAIDPVSPVSLSLSVYRLQLPVAGVARVQLVLVPAVLVVESLLLQQQEQQEPREDSCCRADFLSLSLLLSANEAHHQTAGGERESERDMI